jgi:gamma-glutamyl-gamma-aminobutyrate hydrolase PuuD
VLVTSSDGSVRDAHLAPLRLQSLEPIVVSASASDHEIRRLVVRAAAVYLPGSDYVPSALGEAPAVSAREAAAAGMVWDAAKVRVDLLVLDAAWRSDTPTLAVCGGMQAMALHGGATLRLASRDELPAHLRAAGGGPVAFRDGSVAAGVFGGSTLVNSYHRQVIARPPSRLAVAGTAPDGVVEAVEAPDRRFWLGVQWHPELLGDHRPYRSLASAAGRT